MVEEQPRRPKALRRYGSGIVKEPRIDHAGVSNPLKSAENVPIRLIVENTFFQRCLRETIHD